MSGRNKGKKRETGRSTNGDHAPRKISSTVKKRIIVADHDEIPSTSTGKILDDKSTEIYSRSHETHNNNIIGDFMDDSHTSPCSVSHNSANGSGDDSSKKIIEKSDKKSSVPFNDKMSFNSGLMGWDDLGGDTKDLDLSMINDGHDTTTAIDNQDPKTSINTMTPSRSQNPIDTSRSLGDNGMGIDDAASGTGADDEAVSEDHNGLDLTRSHKKSSESETDDHPSKNDDPSDANNDSSDAGDQNRSESGEDGNTLSEDGDASTDSDSKTENGLKPEDVAQILKTDDGKIIVVKKDSKKSDGLTIGKLVVSGAAAITASIITTRLAGAVNGLLIVGVSSVVIAVLNEVYRRIFAKMKKISAKAVVSMPLDKILPSKMASKVNDDLQSVLQDTTSTIPVIQGVPENGETSEDKTIESVRDKVTPQDVEATYDRSVMIDETNDGDVRPPRLKTLTHELGTWRGLRRWLGLQWRSWSWITKSMVIVLSFTLLSAGVSAAMSSMMEQPEINVTNVTRHDVKDLSDAEKTAIKDAAVQAVQDQLNGISSKQAELDSRISNLEKEEEHPGSTTSPSPSTSASSKPGQSSSGDVESLRKTVAELQSQVETLKSGSNGSTTGDGDVEGKIAALGSRIDDLNARISALESNGGSTSNQSPSSGQ